MENRIPSVSTRKGYSEQDCLGKGVQVERLSQAL